jgi:glutamate-5-semialdehyde dehydrogenase
LQERQMAAFDIEAAAKAARAAYRKLASAPSAQKNAALKAIAKRIRTDAASIKSANAMDVKAAEKEGLSKAVIDRLALDDKRIEKMAAGVEEVVKLPDPVGDVMSETVRPNGLVIRKVRVPIGVIAIIFESRPNVTVDAGVLCLKSGNAAILRGGKESINSNKVLGGIMSEGLKEAGLPGEAVVVVPTTDRAVVGKMLKLNKYIDLVVPRGGKSLIERVVEESTIPVIKHFEGICHVYVDSAADLEMAANIVQNAKVQRPGVCNAMECLLVHKDAAEAFLPVSGKKLTAAGVELRACPVALQILKRAGVTVRAAAETDFGKEFLDLILAVKVVGSLDEAIAFINTYSSAHTDSIVTKDEGAAARFLTEVDSACVFHNASTRFSDGYEFGLGAEIGISTDRIHARGPMGLEELTIYKWVAWGNGQIRS